MLAFGGLSLITEKSDNLAAQLPDIPLAQNVNFSKPLNAIPLDFTLAARQAMPAVVHIEATESSTAAQKRKQGSPGNILEDWFFGSPFDTPFQLKKGAGSGVIYSSDGYIVTNNHVVDFADEVLVTLSDNRQYTAKVIGKDSRIDLAVLKIEADGLPTLELADADKAQVGEWVLAVGNPFDLNSTVTAGIVSAKGRNIRIMTGQDAIEAFIQTDAAVNPGNSGGALVTADGKLLGINTAIATRTGSFQGYSFAIPVNLMTKVVNDIIEFGSYQRGYLGINISDLDGERAQELGLDITQGVIIEDLADGGAAQFSGLLPLDVITAVNNTPVNSAPELQDRIG
ncbi:MAG: trypsin-like serine protease, partial [Saprospiraceae bacterium]|nr:trypsin-like serine protease [Saprospiraceae bacterium]